MIYCLDTETTGLDPHSDEIIQLSIVNAMNGEVILDEYFRPSDRWMETGWNEASQVTGITPESVEHCRSLNDDSTKNEINSILRQAETIIGYHIAYDAQMLNISAGISMNGYSFEDPMYSFALYYGLTHPNEDYYSKSGKTFSNGGWLPWAHQYVCRSLTDAANYFGIHDFGAHNSLNDVMATIEVWKNMENLQVELMSSNIIDYDGSQCYEWRDKDTGETYPLITPDGQPVQRFVDSYNYQELIDLD